MAGRLRDPKLLDRLVDELRQMQRFVQPPQDSGEYAYTQAILDALITTGVKVPADVIWPYVESRTPEALILLVRSGGDEEHLMKLRKKLWSTPACLVLDQLLLQMRSARFLLDLIDGARPRHTFVVWDQPTSGHGSGGSNAISGVIPAVVREFPKGFPPIGVYELFEGGRWGDAGMGDVLLKSGRHAVYYRRTVVPRGGSVHWPDRSVGAGGVPVTYCIDFLSDATSVDSTEIWRLLDAGTEIRWTDSAALESAMEGAMLTQKEGILHLVDLAKQAGFQNIPPKHIRIVMKLVHDRVKSHEPLPSVDYDWFALR